uniref:Uncharacterized protein n=1 Tax=Leucocytozoon caulleryi TaxID=211597 RepID=U3TQI9_LEUCU|nr:hypothetical protein [Leucocytozoon caulleryi]BAN94694.1 hypothetical protein [Leucocytozoon caulleryi]
MIKNNIQKNNNLHLYINKYNKLLMYNWYCKNMNNKIKYKIYKKYIVIIKKLRYLNIIL